MAFTKSFATSEDVYPLKVLDYFEQARKIRDGEEKLQAVIDGETFLWPFLEGSAYEESKKKLYQLIEDRKEDSTKRPFSPLNKANALLKLQQREALAANVIPKEPKIYGQTGLVVVPEKENKKETDKVLEALKVEEDDPSN